MDRAPFRREPARPPPGCHLSGTRGEDHGARPGKALAPVGSPPALQPSPPPGVRSGRCEGNATSSSGQLAHEARAELCAIDAGQTPPRGAAAIDSRRLLVHARYVLQRRQRPVYAERNGRRILRRWTGVPDVPGWAVMRLQCEPVQATLSADALPRKRVCGRDRRPPALTTVGTESPRDGGLEQFLALLRRGAGPVPEKPHAFGGRREVAGHHSAFLVGEDGPGVVVHR